MPAIAVVPIVCTTPFVIVPIIICAALFLAKGMPLVVAILIVSDAPFADIVPAEGPKVFVILSIANVAPTALVIEFEHHQAEEQQNDD